MLELAFELWAAAPVVGEGSWNHMLGQAKDSRVVNGCIGAFHCVAGCNAFVLDEDGSALAELGELDGSVFDTRIGCCEDEPGSECA